MFELIGLNVRIKVEKTLDRFELLLLFFAGSDQTRWRGVDFLNRQFFSVSFNKEQDMFKELYICPYSRF